jgi:hypothetical protein
MRRRDRPVHDMPPHQCEITSVDGTEADTSCDMYSCSGMVPPRSLVADRMPATPSPASEQLDIRSADERLDELGEERLGFGAVDVVAEADRARPTTAIQERPAELVEQRLADARMPRPYGGTGAEKVERIERDRISADAGPRRQTSAVSCEARTVR